MSSVGMPGVLPISAPAPRDQKILHAAQEFEAVLLNTLLGSLATTFATMPGDAIESSSTHYQYLGMQALSSCLAARGGLGITRLVTQSLTSRGQHGEVDRREKSPTRGASLGRPF